VFLKFALAVVNDGGLAYTDPEYRDFE
jgi:hypothetical protein